MYLPTCTCSSREFDFIHVGSSCLEVWGDKMLIGARMLIGMVVYTHPGNGLGSATLVLWPLSVARTPIEK